MFAFIDPWNGSTRTLRSIGEGLLATDEFSDGAGARWVFNPSTRTLSLDDPERRCIEYRLDDYNGWPDATLSLYRWHNVDGSQLDCRVTLRLANDALEPPDITAANCTVIDGEFKESAEKENA